MAHTSASQKSVFSADGRKAERAALVEKSKANWAAMDEIDRTNIKAVFDGFGFSKGERIYAMANVTTKEI